MGIADEEKKILEELRQLGEEPEEDKKESEDLLKEVTEEEGVETEGGEEEEESEDQEEETSEDDVEEEDDEPEEEDGPEEELTGAKFRHKLKAEKEARESIERQAQELRERLARLEGKAEAENKQEPINEEVPDPEYEPEKYAIYQNGQLKKELDAMKAEQSRINAERQWETMQAEHAQVNPDYNDAKAFLIEAETKKLKTQYPYATEAQILQQVKEMEYITAGNAAKSGIIPTQHIEFLAYQAGYRPGEKKEVPKKKSNIKNIKKNAKKNASLIGGSSAGESGEAKSAEQLAAMGIEEINKFGRDKYEAAIRKIEARS